MAVRLSHQQLAGLDVFRPCSAGGEVVRQSTGVLQEISNGDSVAVVPVAYDRSGQVMLDAHIEVEQSVVDELHDDGRDEGLCVAADSDPRITGIGSPVAVFPIPARMMRVPRDGSEITSCAPGIPCLMTPSSACCTAASLCRVESVESVVSPHPLTPNMRAAAGDCRKHGEQGATSKSGHWLWSPVRRISW